MAFVEFEKVSKIYHTGAVEIPALRDATFQVEKGEMCVIVGASGARERPRAEVLGGMDTLTGGTVKLDGRDISRYDPAAADGVPPPRRGLCVPVL